MTQTFVAGAVLALCLLGPHGAGAESPTSKPASQPKAQAKPSGSVAPQPKPSTKPKPPNPSKKPPQSGRNPPPSAEPQPPHIAYLFPAGGQRGQTVEVTVGGQHFEGAGAAGVSGRGVTVGAVTFVDDKTLKVSVAISPDAALGERDLRVVAPAGVSNRFRFLVGQLPEVVDREPGAGNGAARRLEALPVVVNGQVFGGDKDAFRFAAKAGQTIVCAAQARAILPYIGDAVPPWFQAVLTLYDAEGRELAYVDDFRFDPDPVLILKVPRDGEYLVEIKDSIYRGREDFVYRLSIGALPYLTDVYPLGGKRGSTARVEVFGANLSEPGLALDLPPDCPQAWHVAVTHGGLASNTLRFDAGDADETAEAEDNDSPGKANRLKTPVTVNGRIERPGDCDYFVLAADAKQTLVIEVRARRVGSPLDSIITLLDSQGRQLAQNDDTVDESEQLSTHHADSRLVYTFPAGGDYLVKVADVQGKGGREYAYRLSITPPRPDFTVRITPDNPRLMPGGSAVITAEALGRDGFGDEIHLSLVDAPKGFFLRGATIPAKESKVRFTITAPPDAATGLHRPSVTGSATVAGRKVVRKASPAEVVMQAFFYYHRVPTQEFILAVVAMPSFTLSTGLAPDQVVEVPQGGEVQVAVKVLRGGGTTGQIMLAADDPPKGIVVRNTPIPADKAEANITISASALAPASFRQNLILGGTLRTGKGPITRFAPAIPIRVVAPTTRPQSMPAR